jgi:Putative helicase/Putative conjugal transfer nickase/helicase TraI C-term
MFNNSKTFINQTQLDNRTLVEPAEILLNTPRRKQLIDRIAELLHLDKKNFDLICLKLLHNLANYCQKLPDSQNSYYSQEGGLIDASLNRANAALEILHQYINIEKNKISEDQKLWLYVLFSAAILRDIGKLISEYAVQLFDDKGHKWKKLDYFHGTEIMKSAYYSFEFLHPGTKSFRNKITVILAKQLMPEAGFALISAQHYVLNTWLGLLMGDVDDNQTLEAIFERAQDLAQQMYLDDYLNFITNEKTVTQASFIGRTEKITNGRENIASINKDFINWLKKNLGEGAIIINDKDNNMKIVDGHIFINDKVFKDYAANGQKNWQTIKHAFLSYAFNQAKDFKNGSLVKASNILPKEVTIAVNNERTEKVKAEIVLAKMQFNNNITAQDFKKLNTQGQWTMVARDNMPWQQEMIKRV